MTLPSYSFIFIFLPIVVALYYFFNSKNQFTAGKIVLLAASLVFYFSMGLNGFLALLVSIIINYLIATFTFTTSIKKSYQSAFLALGIILDVCFLLYCRYLTYFELLINKYSGSALTYTALIVPVGISYFTFSQIAYLVNSYRDNEVKYSVLDYALFVSFFPKVTVGPIAFDTEFIPQLNDSARKKLNYDNLATGFYRFTLGLSKKLLIADNLGAYVDLGYLNIIGLGTTNAILVMVAYTLQIYFDFSGYCDIALGIGTMLGLDIVDNFNEPYKAVSIDDFWKRWHISLTRFFRIYVYFPLGGNRKGKVRTYINIMIIFLLSGLWHGAGTTFIVWGAVHGILSILSKALSKLTVKLPKIIRWFMTFTCVNLAWVLFRSPDMDIAKAFFTQLFTGGFTPINNNIIAACIPVEGQLIQWVLLKIAPGIVSYSGQAVILLYILVALLLCTLTKNAAIRTKEFKASRLKIATTVILFVWSVLSLSSVTEFIYVNF